MNPCENCYLSISNKCTAGRKVGLTHTPTRTIMFIGDAPTITDYKTNILFNGRSTKIISKFIDDYQLTHWSIKTNLIKCVCFDPSEYYADKCYIKLIEEIRKYKPVVIVTIGQFVYQFLKEEKYKSMANIVNKPIAFNNAILIPIYSSTYIVRNKCAYEYVKSFNLISNIFADLCKEYSWIKP